jgi:hypothetical protein
MVLQAHVESSTHILAQYCTVQSWSKGIGGRRLWMEGIMNTDDTQDLVVALSYGMEVIFSDFSNMALSEDLLMMLCFGAFYLYCTQKHQI